MSKPDPGMNALGVLALELAGGDVPRHAALSSDQAGELAERVGRDLAKLVPGVSGLDFVFAGAHFDPAEVPARTQHLRPTVGRYAFTRRQGQTNAPPPQVRRLPTDRRFVPALPHDQRRALPGVSQLRPRSKPLDNAKGGGCGKLRGSVAAYAASAQPTSECK